MIALATYSDCSLAFIWKYNQWQRKRVFPSYYSSKKGSQWENPGYLCNIITLFIYKINREMNLENDTEKIKGEILKGLYFFLLIPHILED